MNFVNPYWFAAMLLLPVVWYFYRESIKKKKSLAIKFSNISLIKEAGIGKSKSKAKEVLFYLNLLLIALLITALADPHIPLKQTKEGVNVVMVMDVSGSMAANDYKPTRLEAAKESAKILIDELDYKDNSGIVIFSSGATTSAYLSPYREKVFEKLSVIKQTEGQTALGDGLALAVDMATSIPNKKKVIILMSDGVNNAGVISPDEAISFAKTNNIQVYTVGIGSNENVILGYDPFGRPQYAQLDEATLQKIALETNGQYFKSVDSSTLEKIYRMRYRPSVESFI
jgi:Ca-activated chloride channel family protein